MEESLRKNEAATVDQMVKMRADLQGMKVAQSEQKRTLETVNTLLQDRESKHTPQAGFTMKRGRSELEAEDTKPAVNKNGSASGEIGKEQSQMGVNPHRPKRPISAFFEFMEEFRKVYNEEHPNNKSIAAIGMAGGNKWKSMSAAEKAMYVRKVEANKKEYEAYKNEYEVKMNKIPTEGAEVEDEEESVAESSDEDESGDDENDDWEVI